MKYIFMLIFVGFLAASPVYMFDQYVIPELDALAQSYSSFDQTAQDIAGTNK